MCEGTDHEHDHGHHHGHGVLLADRADPADRLAARLSDPETAAALERLLDLAPLVAALTGGLDAMVRRSDTLIDSVGGALGDLRKTAGGTDTIGNLNSILASAPALNAVVESGMLRPEVMGTLAELGDCVVEGRARATEQGTKVGPFGIVGALRDDDVQKGMGLLIEIARALGKRL